jgi:ABC-2 type transport system ATP-binding protein
VEPARCRIAGLLPPEDGCADGIMELWAIEVENLRKEFRSRRRRVVAVDDISFRVKRGEIYGFLGPNGAGKTTTIKMICGLISPDSGRTFVLGLDTVRQRREAMRKIGAVLEGSRNVYWRYTAPENLSYFATLKNVRIPDMRSRINHLLGFFELSDKKKETVQQLSRGMQQKVAIACALIHDPEVLLLDEPTLGLDVHAAHSVKERVKDLAHKEGKTILLTTHQMDVAQEICDRIAIINEGRIAIDDTTRNLISLFSYRQYDFEFRGRIREKLSGIVNHDPAAEISEDEETTRLRVTFDKPERLYEMMDGLRAAGIVVAGITKVEPNLAEVFMKVISGQAPNPQPLDSQLSTPDSQASTPDSRLSTLDSQGQ